MLFGQFDIYREGLPQSSRLWLVEGERLCEQFSLRVDLATMTTGTTHLQDKRARRVSLHCSRISHQNQSSTLPSEKESLSRTIRYNFHDKISR